MASTGSRELHLLSLAVGPADTGAPPLADGAAIGFCLVPPDIDASTWRATFSREHD